ncbi:MAG: VWA domain-containing protein [Pirellula sp.]|nr:VWA domain-containing protein [Pirellula sp.]
MHIDSNLASSILAQGETRVFYQWMRLETMDQWIHWFGLGCILLLIASYVVFWYRRDSQELPKALGWSLLGLRLLAIIGILVFFLDLQKRSEQILTRPSKVAVLVDTSLSMTMPQSDDDNRLGVQDTATSRIAAVQELFKSSPLLNDLRNKHDITVYRFDQSSRPSPIANFQKPVAEESQTNDNRLAVWQTARTVAWVGTIICGIAFAALITGLLMRRRNDASTVIAYASMFSVVALIIGFVTVATAVLRTEGFAWYQLWSSSEPQLIAIEPQSAEGDSKPAKASEPREMAWESILSATGTESRIGDSLRSILEQERGSPLAGIVLFTDGRSNSGVDPMNVVAEATMQSVPIHTVGMGTAKNPVNVRVLDVETPKRVFPGDRFRLNALIQASGLEGKQITVQLRRRPGSMKTGNTTIEEERSVTLQGDDAISSVLFEIMPREIGTWVYEVKTLPPPQDSNSLDDTVEREVRVVEPNATVLIIAGGPTREYQFVRNLLFRDTTVQSHVFLQTATAGVSQEAQKLLDNFPSTLAEMSQYDCVIAFDAAWMDLSREQIEVLERWVSEQAGGLVLVAGPVATPKWAGAQGNGNFKAETLRNLCPLILNSRGARLVSIGRFEAETAWPLQFASDALQTEFLQVGNNPEESKAAWDQFAGVYNYFACYEPKPGAMPLAVFSDPTTSVNGTFPIYLATQFYGAGRVAFQGSGEFWRLREVGDQYFDTYYTKLVRWAGQGRLMRDSDRGILLLDKEQAILGEQVLVRAVLKDSNFQPLVVPEANAKLVDPTGRSQPLPLLPIPDPSQVGVYVGQFFTKAIGNYEVQLPVGGIAEQVVLSQQLTVRVPAVEIQRPQRNDPLLAELATRTGGKFWIGPQSLRDVSPEAGLAQLIEPRDQTNYLPGTPDRDFQQKWLGVLMAWIVGCLSLEWFIRRMSKLA